MSSHFTVVFDANVLYPAPLRDFLMRLALTDLFRAKWTNMIHDEWIRNVLIKRPELKEQLKRTRQLMNASVRDCLVEDFEYLIPTIELPDEDDRHVVAAAIHGHADMIVTFNLKDFPESDQSIDTMGRMIDTSFKIGQFRMLVDYLEKIAQLDPKNKSLADFLSQAGKIREGLGEYKMANTHYQRLLNHPSYSKSDMKEIIFAMAGNALKTGDQDDAIKILKNRYSSLGGVGKIRADALTADELSLHLRVDRLLSGCAGAHIYI